MKPSLALAILFAACDNSSSPPPQQMMMMSVQTCADTCSMRATDCGAPADQIASHCAETCAMLSQDQIDCLANLACQQLIQVAQGSLSIDKACAAPSCGTSGSKCEYDIDCCSPLSCDVTGSCATAAAAPMCHASGGSCTTYNDCCQGLSCGSRNSCCAVGSGSCAGDGDCCSGWLCNPSGRCCTQTGGGVSCSSNGECCSGTCGSNGLCQ